MKYDDPDRPDLLTTEQVLEIAENMQDHEDITVETPITPYLRLQVNTMNRPWDDVDAYLDVEEVEGMQVSMPVDAYYRGKVSDGPDDDSLGTYARQDIRLNMLDVMKLFRLDSTTCWKIVEHNEPEP